MKNIKETIIYILIMLFTLLAGSYAIAFLVDYFEKSIICNEEYINN